MLKKNTSSKWALLKYAMVLPLCLSFIFISSSAFISKQNIEDLSQELKETSANAIENIVFDMRPTEETVLKADKSVGESQKYPAITKLPAKLSIKAPVRDTTESEEIYYSVDESPVFPGGIDKIGTFIGQNLKYPTEARKKGTQGRVIVSFVIQKDGLVNDAKILEGIGDGCDEEALRVVNLMPKWKPGIKNGKPVNVHFNLPIMYRTDKTSSAKLPDNVLYVVDGTIVTDKNVVESLSPDKIESVNVLKGKSATDKYGDKSKDGVIEITLKK